MHIKMSSVAKVFHIHAGTDVGVRQEFHQKASVCPKGILKPPPGRPRAARSTGARRRVRFAELPPPYKQSQEKGSSAKQSQRDSITSRYSGRNADTITHNRPSYQRGKIGTYLHQAALERTATSKNDPHSFADEPLLQPRARPDVVRPTYPSVRLSADAKMPVDGSLKRRSAQTKRQRSPVKRSDTYHNDLTSKRTEHEPRRGSGDSDRSAAPSYHSTDENDTWPTNQPSRGSPPAYTPHRPHGESGQIASTNSRRSSASSETDSSASRAPIAIPAPGKGNPPPTPAMELKNPWDAEDTPVITPTAGVNREREDGKDNEKDNTDDLTPPQRVAFAAIQALLHKPSCDSLQSGRPEPHPTNVDSQDDDNYPLDELEIINSYGVGSQDAPETQPAAATESSSVVISTDIRNLQSIADAATDATFKREFQNALREHELAQQKLDTLSKKLQCV